MLEQEPTKVVKWRHRLWSLCIGLVLVAIGVCVGLVVAVLTLNRVVLVDFHSGGIREQIHVAGFLIREDYLPPTGFEVIPVPPDVLSGTENWHMAHSFGGWSGVSPNTIGGEVLSVMNAIGGSVPLIGCDQATSVKTVLLESVKKGEPSKAAAQAKQELLQAMDEVMHEETAEEDS